MFSSIKANSDSNYLIRVSYFEIYNEEIRDLLVEELTTTTNNNNNNRSGGKSKLNIYDHPKQGPYVKGAKEEIVKSVEDVMELLALGEKNRSVGCTNMNEMSSRSHSILRIVIEGRTHVTKTKKAIKFSVLNMIDLAGSERASRTGAKGKRLREAGNINGSLLALGSVISDLRLVIQDIINIILYSNLLFIIIILLSW